MFDEEKFKIKKEPAPFYTVGTWLRTKNDLWNGIIIDKVDDDDPLNPVYIVGILGQGALYLSREQLDEKTEVIPYPFETYFKPKDTIALVTIPGEPVHHYKGIITEVIKGLVRPAPIEIAWESGARSRHAPHEIIRI